MKLALAKQLTGIALASAFSVSVANAAMIDVTVSGPGVAEAEAAETDFLAFLKDTTTETFEGFTAATGSADQTTTINTSVGDFTQLQPGGDYPSEACNDGGFSCAGGLAILNADTSPFNGRYPMPDDVENENWLDSMDSQQMKFTLAGMYTAVGFYLTDPNDVGGIMNILFADQTEGTLDLGAVFDPSLASGSAFYVGIMSDVAISSLTFYTNDENDGFGIDNVTVGTVPEPGTLALLGLGLVGMGVMKRRKSSDTAC